MCTYIYMYTYFQFLMPHLLNLLQRFHLSDLPLHLFSLSLPLSLAICVLFVENTLRKERRERGGREGEGEGGREREREREREGGMERGEREGERKRERKGKRAER